MGTGKVARVVSVVSLVPGLDEAEVGVEDPGFLSPLEISEIPKKELIEL